MSNSMSCRIVHDAVCLSKLANLPQLSEIGFGFVLDSMVNRGNKLLGIVDSGGPH